MAQTPYIDLGTLKAYLNIADSDSTQDVFLTNVIPQVTSFIDRYTHRTFGWGDSGDAAGIDYSNTDNIGVNSTSLNGTLLTLNTMGPVPWAVGQNVSLFAMQNTAWNGVWAVTAVNNPAQIVVDVSASKGTLGLSAVQSITNNGGLNANGYVGNFVVNYSYKSQQQFDGLVGKQIYLRDMDIRSIDTLYIGLRNVASPVLLDHTQYVWRNDGRIILGGAYFNSYDSGVYAEANDNSFYGTVAAGYQTITVSYWHGVTGVPGDLALAALDLCTAANVLRKYLGQQAEKIGDYDVRYDLTFRQTLATQPDSLNTLNRYRRRHI